MNRVPLACILLVGFALRLVGLDVHSMWLDEGETLAILLATDPIEVLRSSSHPPLSFLALRVWRATIGESDAALRLLTALVSCGSLTLFARLAQQWLRPSAVLPGIALYSVSPFLVWYGQELRMYAFTELAALVVMHGVARCLVGRRGYLLAGLGTTLALGSHYLGLLVCIGGAAVLASAWWKGRLPLRALVVQGAVMLAGALIWLPWILTVMPDQLATGWPGIARRGWRDLLELPTRLVLVELAGMPDVLVSGISACVMLALGSLLVVLWRQRRLEDVWGPLAFSVPVLVGLLLTFVTQPRFTARYLITAVPGLYLALATGAVSLPGRAFGRTIAWSLVAGCLACAIVLKTGNRKDDYRGAAADLAAAWRDGEEVIVVTGTPRAMALAPIRHYLRHRPEIVARLRSPHDPGPLPSGRFHVHYRASSFAVHIYEALIAKCRVVHEGPERLRAQHLILVNDG